jgi:hypothetical protein
MMRREQRCNENVFADAVYTFCDRALRIRLDRLETRPAGDEEQ